MTAGATRLTARSMGVERTVTIAGDGSLTVDGSTERFNVVRRAASGEYRVEAGDHGWRVWLVADGSVRWVFLDGVAFRVAIEDSGTSRSRATKVHETLSAPMPATVIEVRTPLGAPVKAGDTLIVLEAMKMELLIRAPRDGTVSALHCAAGDLVQPDVPLVELG